jgi:hypothetical protein
MSAKTLGEGGIDESKVDSRGIGACFVAPPTLARIPRSSRPFHLGGGPQSVFTDKRVQVGLSVFSIIVLLVSSSGVTRAGSGGGGNGEPAGITAGAAPYYPYMVSPSTYPNPDSAVPAASGLNVTLPQLGALGVGSTPTYFLLYDAASDDYVGTYPHGYYEWRSHLDIREGTFSPWLATDLWTGQSTSRTVPINWSTPYSITAIPGNCSATALSVASSGTAMASGMTCGSTSYVYQSTAATALTSWNYLASPSGNQLRLALDPAGTILTTTISAGRAIATTIPFPSGTVVSTTLGDATQASPVVLRTVTGDVLGVATISNPWGVAFYSNLFGSWGSEALKVFSPSNTSKIFTSIGGTYLGNPGGTPNQISATVVGQSIVVLFTALDNGTTVAEVTSSATEGVYWNPTQVLPPTEGAISDPQLVGAAGGYVYATWLSTAGLNQSTIQQAVFAADGRILSPAAPLPGGTGPWSKVGNDTVGVALDSLMRPLFVWLAPSGAAGNSIEETGAFLSPVQIDGLMNPGLDNLNANDIASGTLSNFQSGVNSLMNKISANASQASNSAHLNSARNLTAALYQNVSLTGLSYFGELMTPIRFHNVIIGYTYWIAGGAQLTSAVETGLPWPTPSTFGSLTPLAGFGTAETYLQVDVEWLFSAEGVEPTGMSTPFQNLTLPASFYQLPNYGDYGVASTTANGSESQATVTPLVVNPTTLQLSSSGSFASYAETVQTGPKVCNNEFYTNTTVYTAKPTAFNDTPSLGVTDLVTIKSSTFIPALYIQNLSADTDTQWGLTLEASYSGWDNWTSYSGCTGTNGHKYLGYNPHYGPKTVTMGTGASIATTLTTQETVDEVGSGQVNVVWENSMLADGAANLTPDLGHGLLSGFTASYTQQFTGLSLASGNSYSAVVNTSSHQGGFVSSPPEPSANAGEQTSAPVQASQSICQFVYQPDTVSTWNVSAVGGGNSTATVTWESNTLGVGTLIYSEAGTAVNQTATAGATQLANGSYRYSAEIHGLPGGAFYNLEGTTSVTAGDCLNLLGIATSSAFLGQGFSIQPVAYPYDSVTRAGGGEGIRLYLAPGLFTGLVNSVVTFSGGSLTYGPSNLSGPNVTIPIPSLANQTCGGDCYLENITPSTLNASYVVQSILNFTWQHTTYSVDSSPTSFTYLQDTTGDGLTDAEKLAGWTVTYTDLRGVVHNELETAAPTLYSTNGLVGDYVEKEYGLNPNVVDTAGSGMLDTWNLTFNVKGDGIWGTGEDLDFNLWNESSSYNPFASSVQYSPGLHEAGSPASKNISNVTAGAQNGIHSIFSGDGSPWAATVLWSGAAFNTFSDLWAVSETTLTGPNHPFYGLRAVLGTWKGVPTLTVWGKLSWGANPLAASTPGDGIVDGNRADPLAEPIVQLNLTSWSATLKSSNDEAAPYFTLSSSIGGDGTVVYSGYGPAAGGSSASYTGPYLVSAPVTVPGQQDLFLNLSINDNSSSNGIIYSRLSESVTIDLLATHPYWFNYSNSNGSVHIFSTIVRSNFAANTLLVTPANNTTLSGSPWGLKRYVGEPDFDLLVLNLSSPSSVTGILGAERGWRYTATLQAGLNNILVPRGLFLSSPLASALVDNTNESFTVQSGSGLTFHPTDWSGRTETSGTNPVPSASHPNPGYIWVLSNSSQLQNGSGSSAFSGLPANPYIETGAESRQLQASFWINVSSSGYGGLGSASAELEDLFGGLLLNRSGGVSDDLVPITSEVGMLGLPGIVVHALANSTVPNGGSYPAPQYHTPPPQPNGWQQFGTGLWNVASGIAQVSGLETIASATWNLGTAVSDYLAHNSVVLGVAAGIEYLSSQFARSLEILYGAMNWALQTLENQLISYGVQVWNPTLSWEAQGPIYSDAKLNFRGINTLGWAVGNASAHPSSSNNESAEIAAIDESEALLDVSPSGASVLQAEDEVATVLQPFSAILNLSQVIGQIFGDIFQSSSLPAAAWSWISGQSNPADDAINAVVGSLNNLGLGSDASSSNEPHALTSPLSNALSTGNLMDPGIGADFASLEGYLANFWGDVSAPYTYVDLILTVIALEAWVVQAYYYSASLQPIVLTAVCALLTVAGFALFAFPGTTWSYEASVGVDVLSMVTDLISFLDAKALWGEKGSSPNEDALEFEAIVDLIDGVADTVDITLCAPHL